MFTHISGDWHFWQGSVQFMASNEAIKQLRAFDSIDECINWLYLNGNKLAARSLNEAKQAQKKAQKG